MSLAEKLAERKSTLNHVSTVITRTDGKKCEQLNYMGIYKRAEEQRSETGEEQLVRIGESYGFCVDDSPDEGVHCVMANLYIGSQNGAHNYKELKEKKITHILNVATGVTNSFPKDFLYKTVNILDVPEEDITVHFSQLFSFIEEGLKVGGTLVHCNAGISRSATVVIAFLMYSKKLSLQLAFCTVKSVRSAAKPNPGFWRQLQDYERKLMLQK